LNRLNDRVAWITGAGTGVGRGIALALANAGMDLVLSGRRQGPLDEVAELVRTRGRRPLVAPLDVQDRKAVARVADQVIASLGGIHLLVNNAGINTTKRTATEMDPEDWDRVVEVNLTGAFNCFRAVYPHMKARGDGMIINIASMAGKQVSLLGGAAYTASKHGMVALTHSINLEAAEYGIRASVICPGEIDTPLIAARPQPVSPKRQSLMLKPEDLGETIVFVAGLPPHVTIPELWILPTYQVSGQPLP
jgi:NAD(P)-dependent dehydrogenase (short-subunit alcohol dehydrogenase family)